MPERRAMASALRRAKIHTATGSATGQAMAAASAFTGHQGWRQ